MLARRRAAILLLFQLLHIRFIGMLYISTSGTYLYLKVQDKYNITAAGHYIHVFITTEHRLKQ